MAFDDTFDSLFGTPPVAKPKERKPVTQATYTFPNTAFGYVILGEAVTVKLVRSDRGLAVVVDPCYPDIWQVVHMATGRSIVRGDRPAMERAFEDLLSLDVDWTTIHQQTRDAVEEVHPRLFEILKEYQGYQT